MSANQRKKCTTTTTTNEQVKLIIKIIMHSEVYTIVIRVLRVHYITKYEL